jgi:allantoinase
VRAVGGEAIMNEADLIVRGQRVLTPDGIAPAAVTVRGGEIVSVDGSDGSDGSGNPAGQPCTVQLAADEVLLPGLTDTHVHVNEPGRTLWEGFATATGPRRPAGSPRSSTCR